jgi:hypothetical protein
MSENDTDKTLTTSESKTTTESTSTTTTSTTSSVATDTDTKTGSASTTTSTKTSSEFVDDPVEEKKTYTFTEEEKVMSDKQYLDSAIDEILAMIKSNSLMASHSVEENFTSTTRTPSDEPRIVSNLLDAIALALEKLEAEMKAVKNVGTSIQNTDFNESKIAESLGFELTSKQYAPVETLGNGSNAPKYDGDKALTEQTQKYKQQKEGQSSGSGSGTPSDSGSYPSDGGGSYPSGGDGTQPAPTGNTPQSNTPQSNTPQSNTPTPNTVTEPNTPVSNTPEPSTAPQESHTTIINNYYYNNRGGGGGGGRHTEPAPVETPAPEPVVEEVVEEPVVEPIIETEPPIEITPEPIIEEEEIIEEPIASTIPVPAPEPQQSSNTLRKLGVATLVGAGIGAAAYGAHEVMKHKEEKDDYYSNDEEDYATYGYDNDNGEE